MAPIKAALFALLGLNALTVLAEKQNPIVAADTNADPLGNTQSHGIPDDAAEAVRAPQLTPALAVHIDTAFPQSEIFGVKLVNGVATQAILSVQNKEADPITVVMVGGALWDGDVPVRNLSMSQINTEVPAGQNGSIEYKFTTEMHPQDLRLVLGALVSNKDGAFLQIPAFNGTVSVVEAPFSIFDPQIIFLYLFLLSLFAGTCYFIYNTWITTLFPQQRRGGKGGERARASVSGKKPAVPTSEQVSVVGADGPAVTTSSKAYDESWIPAQHLQRPSAQRVRSGTPKGKTRA